MAEFYFHLSFFISHFFPLSFSLNFSALKTKKTLVLKICTKAFFQKILSFCFRLIKKCRRGSLAVFSVVQVSLNRHVFRFSNAVFNLFQTCRILFNNNATANF